MLTSLYQLKLMERHIKFTYSRGHLWTSFCKRWANYTNVSYSRQALQKCVLHNVAIRRINNFYTLFSMPIRLQIYLIDGAFSGLVFLENRAYFTMETTLK